MAARGIGPVAIMLGLDSTSLKGDTDRAVKQMQDSFSNVKMTDQSYRGVANRLDRQFLRANSQLAIPKLFNKRVQLEEREEDLQKALKVGRAREKYGSVGAMGAQLGNVFGEVAEFAKIMGPYGAIFAGVVAGAGLAWKGLDMLKDAVFGLAGAADERSLKEYNEAWADMAAVVGRVFVPILDSATEGVRLFADFLATILPSTEEIRSIFGDTGMWDEVREALTVIAPIVKLVLVEHLKLAAFALKELARNINFMLDVASRLPVVGNLIQAMKTAVNTGVIPGLASSEGAAEQGKMHKASFIGLAELEKQTQIAALESGRLQWQEQQLGFLQTIANATSTLAGSAGQKGVDRALSQWPVEGAT